MRLADSQFPTADSANGWKPHFTFRTPALEPAYDFKVECYFFQKTYRRPWKGRWTDEMAEYDYVKELVRGAVRLSAKEFSIFDPAKAEMAVNEHIASAIDQATRSSRSITPEWAVRAEITMPIDVRKLVQKTIGEEYGIQAKARAAALLMRTTDDLRVSWDKFLNDAAESPNAQHAVRLAENPTNLGQTLEEVLQDRRQGAEKLLTLINKIIEAQQSADILDLVVESETVLRQTLKMMGIPLPESAGGTLLAPLEGDI